MSRLSLLPIFLMIVFIHPAYAQTSKKNTINYRKEIFKLDTVEIMNGQHLALAQAFTIEKFIAYYLEHGKETDTKKYRKTTINELYRDDHYTYFGRKYFYGLIDFFKVENAALDRVPYDELDGDTIRANFIDEIVPASDKKLVARRERNNMSLFINPSFRYLYLSDSGYIEITYKWKVYGDFWIKIINKTYKANYDMVTKRFKPTAPVADRRQNKKSSRTLLL
jgi:hypothetical protein